MTGKRTYQTKEEIAERIRREELYREKIWMKTTIRFHPEYKKWLWFAWDINQNAIGNGSGRSIRACSVLIEELRKRVVHAAKNEMEQKP